MSEPASVMPGSVMPTAGWVSAHVFHANALDVLIIDAIAPLVGTLTTAGFIDGFFFLRYWEGGPHLRLRLRLASAEPQRAAEVRGLVIEGLMGYRTTHPSIRQMTPERYAAQADRFAASEGLPCYERALRSNNSIAFIAYQPEHNWYGMAGSLAAVERHFIESSELALGLLTGGMPPQRRTAVALALLSLTLATCEPDPGRVAEWFTPRRMVIKLAPGDLLSDSLAGFEAGYRRRRRALLAQTTRLWEAASRPIDLDQRGMQGEDTLSTWLRSVRALHRRLTDLCTQVRFPPLGTGWPTPSADHAPATLIPADQTLPGGPDAITLVLMRCVHLLCNRLGLSMTDEVYQRFLLARALTEFTASSNRTDELAETGGQSAS